MARTRASRIARLTLLSLISTLLLTFLAACTKTGREDGGAKRSLVDEIAASQAIADADVQAPVTLANLYEREAFWPHHIQLTEDWKPMGWGEGEFGWGLGVVVRIDESARIRVDFSRFGKHWVPARVTDVLDRANALRIGADQKFAPNLVLALKNRLLDPSGRELVEISQDVFAQRAWVLVFADPRAEEFAEISRSVAAIAAQEGTMVVLVAQGGHADSHIYKACYDAEWPGAFLLDRFGPAYTEAYLDGDRVAPYVQLMTPDGRLLWEASWSVARMAALGAELGAG